MKSQFSINILNQQHKSTSLHLGDVEKMKLQHKYNKVLFVLLERTLNNDFFSGKIHMNLSKDPPSNEFNKAFEHWISRDTNENPQMGLVHLELHYKVDPLLELYSLKDDVDNSSRNFLNHKSRKTFVVILIMNSLSKDLYVCSLIDQKSVVSSLLSMKVGFKTIVCICDQKSFKNLVVTLQGEDFIDISMEYGFYQASKQEVPLPK